MTAGHLRRGGVVATACTVALLVSACGSGARGSKPPDPDASAPDAPGSDAPFLDDAGEPDGRAVVVDGAAHDAPAAPPGSRPNIVYIMADDLGYGDLPAYGATDMKTPHIDRLGQEGVRFTQFYGDTWCAPSRVSLMSGRYPQPRWPPIAACSVLR
jgi:hypothetical protein